MQKNTSFVVWSVVAVVILVAIAGWQLGYFRSPTVAAPTDTTMPGTTQTGTTGGSTSTSGSTTGAMTLNGTTFRYTSYDANVIPANENYLISFGSGQLSGKICNSFSGPYSAASGVMTVKLVNTAMACTSPKDVTAAEQIFNAVFSDKAPKYAFDGSKLSISGSGHTVVFNAFSK